MLGDKLVGLSAINVGVIESRLELIIYIAKGKKRLIAEIVPKLSRDNFPLSATSNIKTALILIP